MSSTKFEQSQVEAVERIQAKTQVYDKNVVENPVQAKRAAEGAPVVNPQIFYTETENHEAVSKSTNTTVWRSEIEQVNRHLWTAQDPKDRDEHTGLVVRSFDETKKGSWPPRQEVLFAIPEGKKESRAERKIYHTILLPEVHIFLDDITLQENGNIVFKEEVSALLKLRYPNVNKDKPKRSFLEKFTFKNTLGKAEEALRRKKEDGYTRPSLKPLIADYIPISCRYISRTDIDDFVSEVRIRLTLSEMVISSKDWSWGEDGKLTVKGMAATTLLSGAQLWIPKEDPVLRDYRAMRHSTSTGPYIDCSGQINLLWTLLSKRNRVWIVDCHPRSVEINFLLTEELDDARMAHENGSLRLHFFSNLGSGNYERPCCNDKLGGPSQYGKLERLLIVAHKAAEREEKDFANLVSERRKSPFPHMFENSRPRTEAKSLLAQAILALDNVDAKISALPPQLQGKTFELRRQNLDVTGPKFDLALHLNLNKKSSSVYVFFNNLKKRRTGDTSTRDRAQSVPEIKVSSREVFDLSRRKTVIPVISSPMSKVKTPGMRGGLCGPSPTSSLQSSEEDEGQTVTSCCGIPISKGKGLSFPSSSDDREKEAKRIWERWPQPPVVRSDLQPVAQRRDLFICKRGWLCHACKRTPAERRKSTYQDILHPGEPNGPYCIFHRSDWATWNPPPSPREEDDSDFKMPNPSFSFLEVLEMRSAKARIPEALAKLQHLPAVEVPEGEEQPQGVILHRNIPRTPPPVDQRGPGFLQTFVGEHYVQCSILPVNEEEDTEEEGDCPLGPGSPDTASCEGSERAKSVSMRE